MVQRSPQSRTGSLPRAMSGQRPEFRLKGAGYIVLDFSPPVLGKRLLLGCA